MSNAIRRLFVKFGSAAVLVALVLAFAFAGTTQVQAEGGDGVTMTHGGVYGRLIAMKVNKAFKSSATPIGGNSSVEPTGSVPGRISLYNTNGSWQGVVKIWLRKSGAQRFTMSAYNVTVDVGDPLHFTLTDWNANYKFALYDGAGKRVRFYRIWTSRSWAKRHAWVTRQRDIVVAGTGDGGGGNNNPPPVTNYPKGSIVTINGRQGSALTRIDYTVGATTLAFAYPNITVGNWAYEAFPAWYSDPVTHVVEKVSWSDASTQTKTISAPMSATAEATVNTFAGN